MKIFIRVDASLSIGAGHVMRCLTLAAALLAEGAQIIFICREHPGNLIAQIRLRGFAVHVLPPITSINFPEENWGGARSIYESWLGVDWSTDAEQSKVSITETIVDWIIVDHYGLDARWERALRPFCRKLMVIDDLANRQHDCDLLIDQNWGRDVNHYHQLIPMGCKVLVGPQHALLRPEFREHRNYSLSRRATPQLRRLLITMGGVDRVDTTSKVLVALKNCPLPLETHITVVMGESAPFSDRVQMLSKTIACRTEVMINVGNMAQLMADSDFAIAAAGSTIWELCCLAVPTLLVKVAENQANTADLVAEAGAGIVIEASEIDIRIPQVMNHIFEDINVIRKLSDFNRVITDGCGVSRVVEAILSQRN